jgi:hypothetical protein
VPRDREQPAQRFAQLSSNQLVGVKIGMVAFAEQQVQALPHPAIRHQHYGLRWVLPVLDSQRIHSRAYSRLVMVSGEVRERRDFGFTLSPHREVFEAQRHLGIRVATRGNRQTAYRNWLSAGCSSETRPKPALHRSFPRERGCSPPAMPRQLLAQPIRVLPLGDFVEPGRGFRHAVQLPGGQGPQRRILHEVFGPG